VETQSGRWLVASGKGDKKDTPIFLHSPLDTLSSPLFFLSLAIIHLPLATFFLLPRHGNTLVGMCQ
jgi:hypothetical protein